MTGYEWVPIAYVVSFIISFLFVWAICVAAGNADRQMERYREEEHERDIHG